MYDIVLMDLDGTIMDSQEGVINGMKYALEKMGAKAPSMEVLYSFIGPPLLESFAKCGFPGEAGKETQRLYREYYDSKGAFEGKIFPGIEECLIGLKAAGKKIIVATSKPDASAKSILEYFKLAKYFDFIGGATLDETRSKKVDVIRYALEQCRVTDIQHAVMVGDRKYDVNGAAEVGMDCIGVLYGYGSREEFEKAGARYIVETPKDIVDVVCG